MLAWIIKKINCKKTAILIVGIFVAVFLFLNLTPVLAQLEVPGASPTGPDTFGLEQVGETIDLPGTDVRIIIARIIRAVLGLLGIITLVIVMYAGFTIMTAGGNEEKVTQGKKMLTNATIGLIIILASVSIVQFLLNMLSGNLQVRTPSDFVKKPYLETYSGSGALGTIVKDHYPMRDQVEVKRNTSIMVTFAEPVEPASLIANTNNSCWDESGTFTTTTCGVDSIPAYGDCLDAPDGFTGNYYSVYCDSLVTSSVEIYQSADEEKALVSAAAMTTYDGQGDARTFVFKPINPIGSDTNDIWYTVDLRPSILKKTKPGDGEKSIFAGAFSGHYLWEFQTDTNFDFDPPYVVMARPLSSESDIPRNRIIQITFSEAMNPITVQGIFGTSTPFDHIVINKVNAITEELEVVPGEWKITNGYKTIEFISDEDCGLNSCGEMMYCLPLVCEDQNDTQCFNPYGVLLRTALPLPNGVGFASYPLTGVMDTADNGLDGNNDTIRDGRPPVGKNMSDGSLNSHYIGDDETTIEGNNVIGEPDNYYWSFDINNTIDRAAPYIEHVSPDLDQGSVSEKTEVGINFSKVMRISTMDYLKITEHPDDSHDSEGKVIPKENRNFYGIQNGSCFLVGPDLINDKRCLDKIWVWDTSDISEEKTQTRLLHRDFGPNGYDFYYFPEIPSEVTDENQNCMYPGYGPDTINPGETPTCSIEYNENGDVIKESITNCVEVDFVSSTDTGCVHTTGDAGDKLQPDIATCINVLKDASPVFAQDPMQGQGNSNQDPIQNNL